MYYCTLYVYKLNLTTGLYVQKKKSISGIQYYPQFQASNWES